MFIAFLKSSWYDRIVRMTQYRVNNYDSDYSNDSDEENQYDIDNKIIGKKYKSSFNEDNYYIVSYENTDTELERICKDCINYSSIVICFTIYVLFVYVIIYYII